MSFHSDIRDPREYVGKEHTVESSNTIPVSTISLIDNGIPPSEHVVIYCGGFKTKEPSDTCKKIFEIGRKSWTRIVTFDKPWHHSRKETSLFSLEQYGTDIHTVIAQLQKEWVKSVTLIGNSIAGIPVAIARVCHGEYIKRAIYISPAFSIHSITNKFQKLTGNILDIKNIPSQFVVNILAQSAQLNPEKVESEIHYLRNMGWIPEYIAKNLHPNDIIYVDKDDQVNNSSLAMAQFPRNVIETPAIETDPDHHILNVNLFEERLREQMKA